MEVGVTLFGLSPLLACTISHWYTEACQTWENYGQVTIMGFTRVRKIICQLAGFQRVTLYQQSPNLVRVSFFQSRVNTD